MAKSTQDWVVAGGKHGELAHCTRCGEGLTIGTQRIEVVVAAGRGFTKAHAHCKPGMSEEQVDSRLSWFHGRDTGTSSLTIYNVFTGTPTPHHGFSVPWDPADFGRCYRLLKLFPEWLPRLGEVADRFPKWRGLVDNWAELTALYEEELPRKTAPKLYARMKELTK